MERRWATSNKQPEVRSQRSEVRSKTSNPAKNAGQASNPAKSTGQSRNLKPETRNQKPATKTLKPAPKIHIAGHRGMVGAAILDELTNSGYTNIITCSRDELDLRDQQKGNAFI